MRRPCPFSIMARYCQYERALPREKPPYRSRHGTPSVYPYFQCGRFSPVTDAFSSGSRLTAAARTGVRSGGFSSRSRKDKKRRRPRLSGAAFFASVDKELGLSSLPDLYPSWPKFFQTDATRCHSPSRRPKGDVPGARYVGFIAG